MRLPSYANRQFHLLEPAGLSRPEPVPAPAPASPERDDLRRLRESLAGTAAAKLTNASELMRSLERSRRTGLIPTTLPAVDDLLGGGLPRGCLVELTGRRGAGRFSVVLTALAAATGMGEAAALVDLGDHLDPQLAEAAGVDLRRLLWIRPQTLKQAVMSAEIVTAAGFQFVVLDAGLHPIRGRRAPEAAWVRLGRAAEAHGAAMLVSTPYPMSGTASEAVIAASRTRLHWAGRGRSPRLLTSAETSLRLEKHRHRKAGQETTLRLRFDELDLPAPQDEEQAAAPSRSSSDPSDANASLRERLAAAGMRRTAGSRR